jgi:uncharacterized membrane protein YdjX (TVP38/TMEM64 family)
MFPAMVMAMAGGAVFGLVAGTILTWLGSSIGQIIAFIIGRYLLRESVKSYLTKQFPKWIAIDRAMEQEGWKLVILLRLSPIAPWNILNYALSVTGLRILPYTWASSIAIIPYLVMFVYFGSLARDMADIFTGEAAGFDSSATIIMAIVSAALIIVLVWYTTHISRRAIGEALMTHADELPSELTEDAEVVNLLGGNVGGDFSPGGGRFGRAVELSTLRDHHYDHHHPYHRSVLSDDEDDDGIGGGGDVSNRRARSVFSNSNDSEGMVVPGGPKQIVLPATGDNTNISSSSSSSGGSGGGGGLNGGNGSNSNGNTTNNPTTTEKYGEKSRLLGNANKIGAGGMGYRHGFNNRGDSNGREGGSGGSGGGYRSHSPSPKAVSPLGRWSG